MKSRALALVATGGEDLLELVDGEHEPPSARLQPAAACSSRIGCSPGRIRTCRQSSLPGSTPPASAGSSPAWTTDDLPLPDGPMTPSIGAPTSRATSCATSCSRPKKYGASATSNDASPLNGHTTGSPGVPDPGDALARRLQRHDAVGELGLDRAQVGAAAPRPARRPRSTRRAASRRAHSPASSCTRRGTPPLASSSESSGMSSPANVRRA